MRFGPQKETMVGGIAMLVLAVVLGGVYGAESQQAIDGYEVQALFSRSDGLAEGAQVRMAGLPVGEVMTKNLTANFRSLVTLRLEEGVLVPEDTAAVIRTDGLLGDKYVELEPGGALDNLAPGGTIDFTQGSVIVEDLLAKIIDRAKAQRGIGDATEPSTDPSPFGGAASLD